jgi:hypothetical protein
MRFGFTILTTLMLLTTARAQKTDLDFINENKFEPEGEIKGIGLVEINLGRDSFDKDLIVYDSNEEPRIIITATDDNVVTKIGGKSFSRNDNTNPFNPRLFGNNPGYFRLIFDCTKSTDKYYQVIIDQKTNETGFIKKADRTFKFVTVVEYVTEWTEMGLDFDRTKNALRQEPFDNATVILNDKQKKIKIWTAEKIELKGDWIKIKTADEEEGWIKWRQGNQIIIRLYFAC